MSVINTNNGYSKVICYGKYDFSLN